MNLWFRMIRVLILALLRPRLGLLDVSRIAFRVWPFDLDVNVHMNNARYVALMDLGRLDIIVRSGLGGVVLRRRLQPVIASAMVRYRRSLLPFERFTLVTRVIGWDDKWLYIEHRLERAGELVCLAVVKGLFLRAYN
jgi:acyl-CoA thioesterase FadM